MPLKFEIREVLRKLERAGLENMLPVWDDGRMIVEEGHIEGRIWKWGTRPNQNHERWNSPLKSC